MQKFSPALSLQKSQFLAWACSMHLAIINNNRKESNFLKVAALVINTTFPLFKSNYLILHLPYGFPNPTLLDLPTPTYTMDID